MDYVKTQLKRIKKRRVEYNVLSQLLLSNIDIVKNNLKKYISDDDMIYIDDIIGRKTIIENNTDKKNTFDNDDQKSYMDVLYKKLALKTHPDKEDIEAVNDDFCEINTSYKKRDISTLFEYALKYNVLECVEDKFYNEVVLDLEKELIHFKKEISKLRNSLLYMLVMDLNDAVKMVIDYIKLHKENEKLKMKIMTMTETKNQYTDYIKFNK